MPKPRLAASVSGRRLNHLHKSGVNVIIFTYKLGFLSDFVVCVSGKRGVERAASKGSEASLFGVYESLPPRSVKTVTKRGF